MSSPLQQLHEVPRATVSSAVSSLAKWMRARAAAAPPNLLGDERDDFVVLVLSLRRVPASRSTTSKPYLLPLPHPVLEHSSASVCLISDDRPSSRSPPSSALLEASKSLQVPVSEVIPLSTLRTDYRPYESRRRLAGSHDLFLADRAILPLLPRVLGKAFYSTKKAPLAVDLSRVGWPEQVRRVLGSTCLYLRSGTCSGIKVGRLDMAEEEIVENVMAAVEEAVARVPKKWANVRALHLKAVDSVALPIYQVVPEIGMKIDVPLRGLEGDVGAGEVVDAAEEENEGKKNKNKKKALRNANWDGELAGGEEVAEESGKRKRNKKGKTNEVVVGEEIQKETEKRKRRRKGVMVEEVGVDEVQELGEKDKESGRALDEEVEEVGKKKHKGKREESQPTLEEVKDVGKKKNKGKKGESKGLESDNGEGKKRNKVKVGDVEVHMEDGNGDVGAVEKTKKKGKVKQCAENVGEVAGADLVSSDHEVVLFREVRKSKGKKLSGKKMKTRSRVRV